jgi:hypothetical protein
MEAEEDSTMKELSKSAYARRLVQMGFERLDTMGRLGAPVIRASSTGKIATRLEGTEAFTARGVYVTMTLIAFRRQVTRPMFCIFTGETCGTIVRDERGKFWITNEIIPFGEIEFGSFLNATELIGQGALDHKPRSKKT